MESYSNRLLKISEVAEILRVSQMTVIRKCREGAIPYTMVGTMRRVREIDLEYYILISSKNVEKRKPEPKRPEYSGPPAEFNGFGDDEVTERFSVANLFKKAEQSLVNERVNRGLIKVPEVDERKLRKQSTDTTPSIYPSGFDVDDDK